jgi:hypothetical protein
VQTRRRAGLVLTLLFIASLPAVTPRIYASDEIEYFSFLRSLWFDHDLSFDNEYRYFYDSGLGRSDLFHQTFLEDTTPTGRRRNFGTIGCAILWAPFYAAGDLVAHGLAAAGYAVATDGYSRPYVAAVAIGSAFYGFLALLLSLRAVRMLVEPGRDGPGGLVATLAVWFGTPLLFYMYLTPGFSHAISAFAVAAFVVAWLRVRQRWSPGGMALLGALAALMTIVREQDAFIAGGAVLDYGLSLLSSARRIRAGAATTRPEQRVARAIVAALVGSATFAVGFLPQALAYLVLNGRIGPSQLVSRKMTWTAPHALQVIGSPEHGFLFWTPLAALSMAGLVILLFERRTGPGGPRGTAGPAWMADRPRIAVCLLLMLLLQVYVAGSVESWQVAGGFGQRRFVGLTVLLVIGLGVLLSRARSTLARVAVTTALVTCVWWNLAMMVQFGSGMMDRQRLELGRNAYNTFVVVPRELPELGYRYLFHRESFYKRTR